jgi:cysteinyl-tRNA synthetase
VRLSRSGSRKVVLAMSGVVTLMAFFQPPRVATDMIDTILGIIAFAVVAVAAAFKLGQRHGQRQTTSAPTRTPLPTEAKMKRQPPTPIAQPAPAAAHETDSTVALAAARSWGYQLQNLNLKKAEASSFDVLVIDYARDGSDETALTPADLARLKTKPDGSRRVVVAYCSIGEAESYRFYWQKGWKRDKPSWLLGENPDWEENYAVCFWDPGWQQLICGSSDSYIDRLIAQGFDGVYLDKCDVTDDLREHFKSAARSRPNLDADMIAFVTHLSAYAKAQNPGFLIIMQNAETLLEQRQLRQAIDAVAKEELLFGLDAVERPNGADDITEAKDRLDLMKNDGKPVFVVEYLGNAAKIDEAAERVAEYGYVLYVAPKDRELSRLNDRV